MEFMSFHMNLSLASRDNKPIRREGEQVVSHLLFADDMLIFSKETVASLKAVDNELELLATNIGLTINKMESKIFFSKGFRNKEVLRETIGVAIGKLPTRYLREFHFNKLLESKELSWAN